MTTNEAYLATLAELDEARRRVDRTRSIADARRVLALRKQAEMLYKEICAEARARRPVGIGNGPPVYRAKAVRAVPVLAANWHAMSFRGGDN